MVSRGLGVSLAARPTSSVPARFEYDKPFCKIRTNDELELTEGKGCRDEHSADAFESISQASGAGPVFATDVFAVDAAGRATAANANAAGKGC